MSGRHLKQVNKAKENRPKREAPTLSCDQFYFSWAAQDDENRTDEHRPRELKEAQAKRA